ncbi:MAG: hypothetical protein WDZ30_09845 [Cellvibrionaceae bacterium]
MIDFDCMHGTENKSRQVRAENKIHGQKLNRKKQPSLTENENPRLTEWALLIIECDQDGTIRLQAASFPIRHRAPPSCTRYARL